MSHVLIILQCVQNLDLEKVHIYIQVQSRPPCDRKRLVWAYYNMRRTPENTTSLRSYAYERGSPLFHSAVTPINTQVLPIASGYNIYRAV